MIGIPSQTVRWKYDTERDVLYLTLGEPRPSYVLENDQVEGLHIRLAVDTDEVTGAVILYYSSQSVTQLASLLPFDFDFSQVH